jgi:hypothetical protein
MLGLSQHLMREWVREGMLKSKEIRVEKYQESSQMGALRPLLYLHIHFQKRITTVLTSSRYLHLRLHLRTPHPRHLPPIFRTSLLVHEDEEVRLGLMLLHGLGVIVSLLLPRLHRITLILPRTSLPERRPEPGRGLEARSRS